ncbi:MAG: hypothetical protein ACSLFF_10260 [Solirubrobacterales bacterium]
MPEQATAEQFVAVSISDRRFAAPVLERLVSAAAARAELPVDRVINALTVVDSLLHAVDAVISAETREIRVSIGEGSVGLCIEHLQPGQAEAIIAAAHLPGLGDVLKRTAARVVTEDDGSQSALMIALR